MNKQLRSATFLKNDLLNILHALAISADNYPEGAHKNGYGSALISIAAAFGIESEMNSVITADWTIEHQQEKERKLLS